MFFISVKNCKINGRQTVIVYSIYSEDNVGKTIVLHQTIPTTRD